MRPRGRALRWPAALALAVLAGCTSAPGEDKAEAGRRSAAVEPDEAPAPLERLLDRDETTRAATAAGCVDPGVPEVEDRDHVDEATAPPAEEIYALRPPHSGPHLPSWLPTDEADDPVGVRQLDERLVVHNLEHGAVIAWYDPRVVDAGAVQDWTRSRNLLGYRRPRGGVAVFSSPYTDPGLQAGAGVALRAWGAALDCERWDPLVADAFVADHFGEAGIAPERRLAGMPDDALRFRGDGATV